MESIGREGGARIAKGAVSKLAVDPYQGKRLSGSWKVSLWRLRIGPYRLIYTIQSDHAFVLILRIGHRKGIYRHLEQAASRFSELQAVRHSGHADTRERAFLAPSAIQGWRQAALRQHLPDLTREFHGLAPQILAELDFRAPSGLEVEYRPPGDTGLHHFLQAEGLPAELVGRELRTALGPVFVIYWIGDTFREFHDVRLPREPQTPGPEW